jgi:WD40 repeat protein
MGFLRLRILDVRILGAIAVALVAIANFGNPGSAPRVAGPRLARGEQRVEATSLATSKIGEWAATTDSAGRVVLRTLEAGARSRQLLNFPGFATSTSFSPDGRLLAAAGFVPVIYFWKVDSENGEPVERMKVPIDPVRHIMFSPDGRSLAVTADRDGTVLLMDLATHQQRMLIRHQSPVLSLAFSPDGRSLATAGRYFPWSILLWDLPTGSHRVLLADSPGPIAALAFSPDGKLLASASMSERHIRLWNTKTQKLIHVLAGHLRAVNSVVFSPKGSVLATASNDGMLGLWDAATGRRLGSIESQVTCLRTVAFAPDGRTIIVATEDDDDVRLWDVAELL